MSGPPHLHPEDRADFAAVLQLALSTPDIRSALPADSTGQAATRLRATALKAADGTPLPALMVLTPPVAATSAAFLLVLGYLLQLADVQGTARLAGHRRLGARARRGGRHTRPPSPRCCTPRYADAAARRTPTGWRRHT